MKRVTGIGGVFFKARDPEALRAWYREHLGLDIQDWGGTSFRWDTARDRHDARDGLGGGAETTAAASATDVASEEVTVWSIFPASSTYFDPSKAPFMINYRVLNLAAVLDALRAEGCVVDERTETSEFGSFGWVMDPEGNRIELWEPPRGRFPG
ncbi:MAG TPA: VOC family protein [Candidatus Krumholzibacteria bacterium]|nr:VOC family protein [Candidatus Krumholzibacteria bacterium]